MNSEEFKVYKITFMERASPFQRGITHERHIIASSPKNASKRLRFVYEKYNKKMMRYWGDSPLTIYILEVKKTDITPDEILATDLPVYDDRDAVKIVFQFGDLQKSDIIR